MNIHKLTYTILLAGLCAVPAVAQQAQKDSVDNCVTAAIQRAVAQNTQANAQTDELTEDEKKDADKELQHIRNTWDSNASFEKYPYLLDPVYRRASDELKQSLRRQYTQPGWAKGVGL